MMQSLEDSAWLPPLSNGGKTCTDFRGGADAESLIWIKFAGVPVAPV
jgi:hypothetical protein